MKTYQVIKNNGYPEAEVVLTTKSEARAIDKCLDLDSLGYPSTYVVKRALLNVKDFVFRNEVIGKIFIFDCDIEVTTDLSGEITDYSGCGYGTARALLSIVPEELK